MGRWVCGFARLHRVVYYAHARMRQGRSARRPTTPSRPVHRFSGPLRHRRLASGGDPPSRGERSRCCRRALAVPVPCSPCPWLCSPHAGPGYRAPSVRGDSGDGGGVCLWLLRTVTSARRRRPAARKSSPGRGRRLSRRGHDGLSAWSWAPFGAQSRPGPARLGPGIPPGGDRRAPRITATPVSGRDRHL